MAIPCTLTINGEHLEVAPLRERCREKLGNNTAPDWEKNIYLFIDEWLGDEPLMEIQTSGSTSAPKRLKVEKQAMVASARATAQYFQLQGGDAVLLCLPLNFIAGKMMIVRAFVSGLNLHIVEPCANPLEHLDNKHFRFAAMVPLQLESILQQGNLATKKLEQIDILLLGGSSISNTLCEKISRLANPVYAGYGMTETLTHIAVRRLNGENTNWNGGGYEPLPGVSISRNSDSCLVADVEHLNIRNLATNDIIELHRDGRFDIIGRLDNVINTGAIKVFPEQVEKKLEALFKNTRFFIFGEEDARLQHKVALMIEGETPPPDQQEILANKMANILQTYEKPRAIYFLNKFTETESGKLQRSATLENFYENI
jgi:O-succinylbenzoic acid--CoA ligase